MAEDSEEEFVGGGGMADSGEKDAPDDVVVTVPPNWEKSGMDAEMARMAEANCRAGRVAFDKDKAANKQGAIVDELMSRLEQARQAMDEAVGEREKTKTKGQYFDIEDNLKLQDAKLKQKEADRDTAIAKRDGLVAAFEERKTRVEFAKKTAIRSMGIDKRKRREEFTHSWYFPWPSMSP